MAHDRRETPLVVMRRKRSDGTFDTRLLGGRRGDHRLVPESRSIYTVDVTWPSLCTAALACSFMMTGLSPAEARPGKRNVWEWLVRPHQADIDVIVTKTQNILTALGDDRSTASGIPMSEIVNRPAIRTLLDDARGMVRYGLRLRKHDPTMVLLLARVEDLRGERETAIQLLDLYLRSETPKRIKSSTRRMLAKLLFESERFTEASAQLRLAGAAERVDDRASQQLIVDLASILVTQHRTAEAIDMLDSALRDSNPIRQRFDIRTRLALAIACDRDGQVTRAHSIIETMTSGGESLLSQLERYDRRPLSERNSRFLAPIEQRYEQAFVYEISDMLPDALSEWRGYLASDLASGAQSRGRARQHIRAIEAQLARKARSAR